MEGQEMVKAWNQWLNSAEGKKCADPNTIGNGPKWRTHLENRLQAAFYAGIEAEEASSAPVTDETE